MTQSYSNAMLDAVVSVLDDSRVVRIGQGDKLTADSLANVSHLVAIYPTWWGSVPAMMLEALGDLVGPWVDGGEPGETSPLRSVTKLTAVASHGSPKLINILQGEPGHHLWKRTLLPLCAPDATFSWRALYGLDTARQAKRVEFLNDLAVASSWP